MCLLFVIGALAEFAYAYIISPKCYTPEWEPDVIKLIDDVLTEVVGQNRCCCCHTKNIYHKPIWHKNNNLKLTKNNGKVRKIQQNTKLKKHDYHQSVQLDSKHCIDSNLKKQEHIRSHLKSTLNLDCPICYMFKECCTCPTCVQLKCPQAIKSTTYKVGFFQISTFCFTIKSNYVNNKK